MIAAKAAFGSDPGVIEAMSANDPIDASIAPLYIGVSKPKSGQTVTKCWQMCI